MSEHTKLFWADSAGNDHEIPSEVKVSEQLDRIEAMLIELTKKKVSKPRASRDEYPDWFEALWSVYPKRAGSNPKRKAYSAATTRADERDLSTGQSCAFEVIQVMIKGTMRYAKFCDATGKTGTEYVMQACRFFGPDKHYQNDWVIPASVTKAKVPKDNDEMLTWAVKRGMRQPHQGESWNQYRAYVAGEA